jgi:hypothetical protein
MLAEANAQLVAEISALRTELASIKSAQVATSAATAEQTVILRRWNGEGLPPDRMDYAKVTSEKAEIIAGNTTP